MNKLRSILVCSFIFISIQISWCQNYLYSNEAPDVYRKDNSCVIAENYLKEKFIPKGWKYSRISAAAYKFPNGNKLIVINGVTSYTEKQELYSENGWLTNKGYTNHVSKLKENEENIYYAIVVSASGEAIKAIKVCPRFVISVLNDDRFLIIAGNPSLDEDTEYKSYYTYHNILCFSNSTGKEIWAVRNYGKMKIYDYTSIGNNLLIVGNGNGSSCYKMIDMKTGKVLEEKTVAPNSTYIKVSCDGGIIKVEERINKDIHIVKLGEHYSNGIGQLARKTDNGTSAANADGNSYVKPANKMSTAKKSSNPNDGDDVWEKVEVMPKFQGDWNAYLKENLKYPPYAEDNGIQGDVEVSFIVEPNGKLSNITAKGPNYIDKTAIILFNNMNRKLEYNGEKLWSPGRHEGEVVRVRISRIITFRL